jgi:rRNA-processing protein FCF1
MTNEERLFLSFKGKSVLLDSNLLLVFLSGPLGANVFKAFKRISDYSFTDYELLVRLLRSFSILVTTPHILTEASNLANSLTGRYKHDWFMNFAALISSERTAIGVRERWTPAAELAKLPEFVRFGLTDTALAHFSSEALVVTEDYRLSGALASRGIPVLNFRDLRKLQRYGND